MELIQEAFNFLGLTPMEVVLIIITGATGGWSVLIKKALKGAISSTLEQKVKADNWRTQAEIKDTTINEILMTVNSARINNDKFYKTAVNHNAVSKVTELIIWDKLKELKKG